MHSPAIYYTILLHQQYTFLPGNRYNPASAPAPSPFNSRGPAAIYIPGFYSNLPAAISRETPSNKWALYNCRQSYYIIVAKRKSICFQFLGRVRVCKGWLVPLANSHISPIHPNPPGAGSEGYGRVLLKPGARPPPGYIIEALYNNFYRGGGAV